MSDFDFAGLTDHLSTWLTKLVEMFYHIKEWFANVAFSLKENEYEATTKNIVE